MQKRAMSWSVPITGLVAVLAAGPLAGRALAVGAGGGTKVYAAPDHVDVQIYVDPVNGTMAASGSLGTARSEPFLPAAQQFKEIGCWVDAGYSGAMFTCQAITAAGQLLRCSSVLNAPATGEDPVPWGSGFAQGIATLNGDSYLTFITDLVPGQAQSGMAECIGLRIDNNSKYYPRLP
jgi:hypothetical protein